MPERRRPFSMSRRSLLAVGGAAAGGMLSPWRAALEGAARARALPAEDAAVRRRLTRRLDEAYRVRIEAARRQKQVRLATLANNGDEERYRSRIASFSKSLPHSRLGEVDTAAYSALLRALASDDPSHLERVPLGGPVRMANPRAALAFGLEGADGCQVETDPPPRFDSAGLAAEACELYWQALTRDVPFSEYERHDLTQQAAAELGGLSSVIGAKDGGTLTATGVFRGLAPGDRPGPYVSQFLWKEVPYGAIRLVQHVRTATPGLDYLTDYDDWLAVQNGAPAPARHGSAYRYIRSGRDLAAYAYFDFTYQAFLTACLILFGMQGTTDASRPYKGAPYDPGNPYRASRSQSGFVTLGAAHALDLVARVADAALRVCWFHKWMVHRWLRPEEYGGRVHNHLTGATRYPLHEDLLRSAALEAVRRKHGSYLLPAAYPEGCPVHPSFPAGHAAVAGACATVLKAFFDEEFPFDDPVVASADGLSLTPYTGRDLTVGGELDKLAANVAMGRNVAGIHWRSDGSQGLRLGEAVALGILADIKECVREDFGGFSLTSFDGRRVTV